MAEQIQGADTSMDHRHTSNTSHAIGVCKEVEPEPVVVAIQEDQKIDQLNQKEDINDQVPFKNVAEKKALGSEVANQYIKN